MKKRVISTLLLCCMLVLVACGGDGQTNDTGTADTAVETENPAEALGIPSDLRYDGRSFRILATLDADLGPILDDFELDKNADVLSVALYERLVDTEERFGITVDINYAPEREVLGLSRQSINAASDDYDLVNDVADWHREGIYEGLYMPIEDLPYIDLDKPWWNKVYIESVSVNSNKPYVLMGGINHKSVQRSACTFFNIDMLETLKGVTEEDMYNIVLEGKWTLDKMYELSRGVYSDENGNSVADKDDIFGFIHGNFDTVSYTAYSVGLEFTKRDENGFPYLDMNNERSIDLIDKLLALYTGEDVYAKEEQYSCARMFGTGHSLFYINRFYILEWPVIRDNDTNYGIIPVPKYDESIDKYYGMVANNTQWHMVPVTQPDPEFASAITEYMAYYGYEKVIPAYYDITVKFKYTRGDLDGASKMLDLILENQRTDFLSHNPLVEMQHIFIRQCRSGQNTFASMYASYETLAKANLNKIIKTLG